MFSFPVFYVFSIHVFIVAVSFLVILLPSLPYWRNLEESSIVYLYSRSAPFPILFSSSRNNLSVPCTLALIYSRLPFSDSSGISSCRLFPMSHDILLHLKIHTL